MTVRAVCSGVISGGRAGEVNPHLRAAAIPEYSEQPTKGCEGQAEVSLCGERDAPAAFVSAKGSLEGRVESAKVTASLAHLPPSAETAAAPPSGSRRPKFLSCLFRLHHCAYLTRFARNCNQAQMRKYRSRSLDLNGENTD